MSAAGMAGKIRATLESDEWDLAGYTKERCSDLVLAAFSEPLPLKDMVRLSFVVGGGKLVRQKYGDDLVRDFTAALHTVGFKEDNAASCELSSAGSYKRQHDTGKNLVFVHVFPNIAKPEEDVGEADPEGEEGEGGANSTADQDPAEVLSLCEVETFEELLEAHIQGYTQKKRCLDELKHRVAALEAVEKKTIALEALNASEQAIYDRFSPDGLAKKVQIVSEALQEQIAEGELTSVERPQVLDQLDTKLSGLEEQLKVAQSEGKAKLREKIEEKLGMLKGMRQGVQDAAPFCVPLRDGEEIARLRARLTALNRLEKQATHTIDQLRDIGEKPELKEAIAVLEQRSRMWFETDEEFKARLEKCREEMKRMALDKPTKLWGPPSQKSDRALMAPKAKTKPKFSKLDIRHLLADGPEDDPAQGQASAAPVPKPKAQAKQGMQRKEAKPVVPNDSPGAGEGDPAPEGPEGQEEKPKKVATGPKQAPPQPKAKRKFTKVDPNELFKRK